VWPIFDKYAVGVVSDIAEGGFRQFKIAYMAITGDRFDYSKMYNAIAEEHYKITYNKAKALAEVQKVALKEANISPEDAFAKLAMKLFPKGSSLDGYKLYWGQKDPYTGVFAEFDVRSVCCPSQNPFLMMVANSTTGTFSRWGPKGRFWDLSATGRAYAFLLEWGNRRDPSSDPTEMCDYRNSGSSWPRVPADDQLNAKKNHIYGCFKPYKNTVDLLSNVLFKQIIAIVTAVRAHLDNLEDIAKAEVAKALAAKKAKSLEEAKAQSLARAKTEATKQGNAYLAEIQAKQKGIVFLFFTAGAGILLVAAKKRRQRRK